MVSDPGTVLGDATGNGFRTEEALATEAVGAEKVVEQGAEGAAKPACDRNAKPLLGTVENRMRQALSGRFLEDALRLTSAEFPGGGHRLDEIDQPRVEHGSADFQAASHAGAVDLEEDVFGEIGLLVEQERVRQRVRCGCQTRGEGEVLSLDVDRGGFLKQIRQLNARERTEPALMGQRGRLAGAPEELLELEIEAEIAVIDRQTMHCGATIRRAGRGSRPKRREARSIPKVG